MAVVVLAGGTGGAKLARGLLDVTDELVVVANSADDTEAYGVHVAPDPDLVTYWLADRIDERGWGLRDDTFVVMDALRELGEDVWFNLGDRDLAVGLERARRLAEGARLTDALAELGDALGLGVRVLPMSDEPVRTVVGTAERSWPLQEFMIRLSGKAGDVGIEGVQFDGSRRAAPTPEVLEALGRARAIVIGPSNPVISIGPILAVPRLREALAAAPGPVVAVSPLVAGRAVKGPTEAFMAWAGLALTAEGVATAYAGLLDGLVADDACESVPTLRTDVLMLDADGRRRLAAETLAFARALAPPL